MVIPKKACRFCPACELVICHQDEIAGFLAQLFAESAPGVIGNDYVAVETVDRKDGRRGFVTPLQRIALQPLRAMHPTRF